MNTTDQLHRAQASTIMTLQTATRARYSELMRAADMPGDTFKFHIGRLVARGFIVKADDGLYELTAEGKAFSSRLDKRTGGQIAQPKSSMLMVVRCGEYVLGHRRDREPFNGYWGIASAPVLRGVPLAESARRELTKQTGIDAEFRVAGSYRVIDRGSRGTILEDKIFAVMVADVADMPAPHRWSGGHSEWLRVDELLAHERQFQSTAKILQMLRDGVVFGEDICDYRDGDY